MFKGGTEELEPENNPGALCSMEACFVVHITRTAVLFSHELYDCKREVTASSL
jgi:hypothetical protein